jgi:predicted MFS family arabinose efflux permease
LGSTRVARVASLLGQSAGELRQPLNDRSFRWLWLASTAASFARWMELTVTGWLALELTGSPADVALIGVTRTSLMPVAALVGGALADRFDRAGLLRLSQWGNALVIGALAASLLAGTGAFWQLLLATLWLGLSWGIDWPSRRALAADLVGRERVLQAVVLDGVSMNLSRIAGALLGGTLLASWGSRGAVVALVLLSLAAAASLAGVTAPPAEITTASRRAVGPELIAGLRYVRRDAVVWAILLVGVLMDGLLLQYQSLLAVFADHVLSVGAAGLGLMGAATGTGAALGLFVFPSLRHAHWQTRAYVGGSLLACLAVLLFALARSFPVALVCLVFVGLGTTTFGTMQTTILLTRTSAAMRGRVLGLQALTIGSAPFGALELSALVAHVGAAPAVALNAAVCAAAVALVGWRSGLARRRSDAGGQHPDHPEPAQAPTGGAGSPGTARPPLGHSPSSRLYSSPDGSPDDRQTSP